MKTNTPQLPLTVKSNQYGYSPCKTYYYITDANGLIYHHSDGKWRKRSLMELTTHYYLVEANAQYASNVLTMQLERVEPSVNPVGRPPKADKDELKATYRIGLTAKRYTALVTKFGSLAKAVASIKVALIGFALLCTLQSCSDRLCPAYASYRTHSTRR